MLDPHDAISHDRMPNPWRRHPDANDDPQPGTTEPHRQLVRYIGDRADDALRWVVRFQDDNVEYLYYRGDVDDVAFEDRFLVTLNQATSKTRYVHDSRAEIETRTHVEVFDDVAAVTIWEGSTEGIVFAFDTIAVGKLSTFVEECRAVVDAAVDTQTSAVTGD